MKRAREDSDGNTAIVDVADDALLSEIERKATIKAAICALDASEEDFGERVTHLLSDVTCAHKDVLVTQFVWTVRTYPQTVEGLSDNLLSNCTFLHRETPCLEIIKAEANGLADEKWIKRIAFASQEFKKKLRRRSVELISVRDSPAMTVLREVANKPDTTLLIGGASGSGKTMALVGAASEQKKVFPVLLQMEEDVMDSMGDMMAIRQLNRTDGDKKVLAALVRAVEAAVGAKALAAMRELRSGDCEAFLLLVAVDEAGASDVIVRSMCSLTGSRLKAALGLPDESVVTVGLVAAGTGIGGGKAASGGCASSDYTVHIVGQDDEAAYAELNWANFKEYLGCYFGRLEPDAAFQEVVQSNARFAALATKLLQPLLLNIHTDADGKAAHGIRLREPNAILPIVTSQYTAMNGLESITTTGAVRLLVDSLRLHLFPFAPPRRNASVDELRYGIFVDCADSVPWSGLEATYTPVSVPDEQGRCFAVRGGVDVSRYQLPYFAVTLLAHLGNIPALSRSSSLGGENFKAYWVAVSSLAACAACSPALFSFWLQSGSLAPLARYRTQSDLAHYAKLYPNENCIKELRALPDAVGNASSSDEHFLLQLADLSGEVRTSDSFIDRVRTALVDEKARAGGYVRVASVSSPSKFPFADSCLFLEDVMYLFEGKDTAAEFHGEEGTFILDCARMGLAVSRVGNASEGAPEGARGKFVPCDARSVLTPAAKALCEASEALVNALKSIWKEASGRDITKVVRCFVAPNGHAFGMGKGRPKTINSSDFYKDTSGTREVNFVSTKDVSFLKYVSRGPPDDAKAKIVTNAMGAK